MQEVPAAVRGPVLEGAVVAPAPHQKWMRDQVRREREARPLHLSLIHI